MRLWTLALFVLSLLAPTVSHAVQATRAGSAPWFDVCSVSTTDDGERERPDAAIHGLSGHCVLCVVQGHAPASPPSLVRTFQWQAVPLQGPASAPVIRMAGATRRDDAPPRAPPAQG